MKKIFETGMIIFAVMGFWGMIYPDLCFTRDVCRVIDAKNHEALGAGYTVLNDKDIFTRICEAEPEQIQIESKFLDFLESKGISNVGNER